MGLSPGTRLGPYQIAEPIGAGGMGEVYRAHDLRLGRDVAIKIIPPDLACDPERIRRFEQEARAAGALSHPNVCAIYDVGSHDGSPFVVMELLEGETLRATLSSGPLPLRKALDYAVQTAQGLGAAHEKGIVHRDLKPANIFVTRDGRLKVLDFGLAKLAAPGTAGEVAGKATVTGVTAAGTMLGTEGYMSPEQIRGQAVDERTDIFSFGCVLHEMLSGKRPFPGETPADVIAAVLGRDPVQLGGPGSGIPPALQGIVLRSLEKSPHARFSSAHDLALALNAVAEALVGGQLPAESPARSIVVLPFENLSPDPENAFFADGLTEELIADLSKVRTLRVISRTSAMLLKGSKKDVPTIARELNVRYVLEGSVRRSGHSLRITAQLIDAANDSHLWAEKYNGTLEDVFAIQESVSRSIVDALKLTLTVDEKHRLAARLIPNVRAFDLYLRARQESYRLTESALDHALGLAREALEIAGPNALLYSLLGEIEFFYHDQGIRSDEVTLGRAVSWVSKALDLEPDSAAGLRARGIIAARKGDMRPALCDLRRAAELQPSGDTLGFLVWVGAETGRMDEARSNAAEAVAIDPLLWLARWAHAWVALFDGDFQVALKRMREGVERGGGEPVQILFLGVFSAYAGRLDEACDLFARAAGAGASGISTMAAALRALYRRETALARTLVSDQVLRDLATLDKEFSWWLASASGYAGEVDEALHWLSNSIDLGFVNHRFFSTIDPFLALLRGDARFQALMDRAREKQRAFEV